MWRAALISMGLAVASMPMRADDDPLKQALALEASIQKVIDRAETSVACILVSRSDAYARLNQGPGPKPGQLGKFRPPNGGNVNLEILKRINLAAPDGVPDSYGSGVVIDDVEALVLTNYHVVREATKVYVRLPGRQGSYANIHAADERSDLAVLKLIDPPADLRKLVPGEADKVRKGQFVIAIANPWATGFRDGSPSVSWGMLSNVRRRLPGEFNPQPPQRPRLFYYPVLLQTNLNVAPGCSGGALLDLKGNWIGLLSGLAGVAGGDSSGGYAVPLDARMKGIIEKLRRGEEIEYGFLGIQQRSVGSQWEPTEGGPAWKAGMRRTDRIVSINGEPIIDQDDLMLNISVGLAGTRIRMVVDSLGENRELSPVLMKSSWPTSGPTIAANRPSPVHGLRVDYASITIQGGGQGPIPNGVVVRDVEENSPAAKADLKPDRDIITSINGRSVNAPAEFYRLAGEARGQLDLTVHEGSGPSRQVKLP